MPKFSASVLFCKSICLLHYSHSKATKKVFSSHPPTDASLKAINVVSEQQYFSALRTTLRCLDAWCFASNLVEGKHSGTFQFSSRVSFFQGR